MTKLVNLYLLFFYCCCLFSNPAIAMTKMPAVALHYGSSAPLEDLKVFDIVVVDGDHGYDPKRYNSSSSQLYAYAALTEVHPTRGYFQQIPSEWQLGRNTAWNSILIDQNQPAWPDFFASQVIGPLWERGFRGFFIDTLDSYRLSNNFTEEEQQNGIVAVVENLHKKFPGIQLILNRGFEVLPRLKDKVQMVAAESLFQGWNAELKKYIAVSSEDRDWLLQQLKTTRDQLGIPGLVIDYVAAEDREKTRSTANQIKEIGFIPWVTDHDLNTIGIGQVELVPRRIAVLYNGTEYPSVKYSAAHRFLQMPFNHLGYITDYYDVTHELPGTILGDRYAGVVTWFGGGLAKQYQKILQSWIQQTIHKKIPFAWLGTEGFDIAPTWTRALGLVYKSNSSGELTVTYRDTMFDFELSMLPAHRSPAIFDLPKNQDGYRSLITLEDTKKQTFSAAALTPWGGFVSDPYVVQNLPGTEDNRWVMDPFSFIQQALRLKTLPAPDVTTENGRRLLLAHIDGDAFPSKAEMPNNRFAADWMLTDILQKYRIPHAVSIIEAEIAPHGLYPQYSNQLEGIAKRIFALPHVEIASHTYSHPYLWDQNVRHGLFAEDHEAEINLNIPGYTIDFHREIVGSIDYIKKNLSGGKPVNILLWSGDTDPNAQALKVAYENGILNMNGGDTFINKSNPSLTAVRGHGIRKDGYLQIYAPITNENIYTNLWRGPYYGYERVIETFELTEKPRRLKAVNLYYHTYAASKAASLNSLHKVYKWVMKKPLHPIFPSEYIRKVQDFYSMALAKEGENWRIRTNGELRTVRIPKEWGSVNLQQSRNIAGYAEINDDLYIHMASGEATLRLEQKNGSPRPVALVEANARLDTWSITNQGANFRLQGHVPLEFALSSPIPCQVQINGKRLASSSQNNASGVFVQHFRTPHAAATIQAQCATH